MPKAFHKEQEKTDSEIPWQASIDLRLSRFYVLMMICRESTSSLLANSNARLTKLAEEIKITWKAVENSGNHRTDAAFLTHVTSANESSLALDY